MTEYSQRIFTDATGRHGFSLSIRLINIDWCPIPWVTDKLGSHRQAHASRLVAQGSGYHCCQLYHSSFFLGIID